MPVITIKIRRVKGKEPATCITYTRGGGLDQWHPEPDKTEFDVPVIVAYFAIKEGFFEQHPKSKTKLKTVGDQVLPVAEEEAEIVDSPKAADNTGGA